jgi:levanase
VFQILVDRSSVEVFGGTNGTITDRIYPGENSTGLGLYAVGGRAKVDSFKAAKLKSAWR